MSPRKAKKPEPPPAPRYPLVFETYREPDAYWQGQLLQKEPTVFNGWVSIRRYRVTVEEVQEPLEVLQARLQALWDQCDNHHHWWSLRVAAKKLGYELIGPAGSKKEAET